MSNIGQLIAAQEIKDEASRARVLVVDDVPDHLAAIAEAVKDVAELVDAPASSASVPPGHILTVDGKVIPRENAVFLLRDHVQDGVRFRLASDRAYEMGKGGELRRIGEPKLSKKERKRQKREKRASF